MRLLRNIRLWQHLAVALWRNAMDSNHFYAFVAQHTAVAASRSSVMAKCHGQQRIQMSVKRTTRLQSLPQLEA
jgi:hypothetical protein